MGELDEQWHGLRSCAAGSRSLLGIREHAREATLVGGEHRTALLAREAVPVDED